MSSTQPAAASSAAGAASLTSPTSASGASSGGSHFPFPVTAVPLSSDLLLNFTAVRKLHVGGPVNSLDFSAKGDQILLATDEPDEAVYLLSTSSATQKKQIFCRKFGADLVRFTHHPNAALVASKNKSWDDSIRYLSLHDNRYLRYFKGHRDRVTGLSMSPTDDSFLSASADRTVRLWDLRTNLCQGLLTLPNASANGSSSSSSNLGARLSPQGRVLVSHDPAGLVFAVASAPNVIKLYDSRSFDSGPFTTFFVSPLSAPASSASAAAPAYFSWSSLKFSPDGTQLLLSTTESCEWSSASAGSAGSAHAGYTNQILLIDSYEGQLKQRFVGHEFNPLQAAASDAAAATSAAGVAASAAATAASYASLPFDASFSPDGAFVLAGSRAGSVHAWSAESGEALAVWSAPGGGASGSGGIGGGNAASSSSSSAASSPITSVQFCPTKMTFVSTDAQGSVVWWMPPKA